MLANQAETLRRQGASVMYPAASAQLVGLIAVSDPVRTSTAEAVAEWKATGIKVIMATGDGLTTAQSVAARLGVAEVYREVKPQDKLALVERLQKAGKVVAMAGDGINDAPALAKADVGIAMGTGTDMAIISAHVTPVKGDLRALVRAREFSVETVRSRTAGSIISTDAFTGDRLRAAPSCRTQSLAHRFSMHSVDRPDWSNPTNQNMH